MCQICCNIGAVNAMRAEYGIASTYFKRALNSQNVPAICQAKCWPLATWVRSQLVLEIYKTPLPG